jgi:hypothetical protein
VPVIAEDNRIAIDDVRCACGLIEAPGATDISRGTGRDGGEDEEQ